MVGTLVPLYTESICSWVMVLAGPSNTISPARMPMTRSQYFSARSTWWMFSRMEIL